MVTRPVYNSFEEAHNAATKGGMLADSVIAQMRDSTACCRIKDVFTVDLRVGTDGILKLYAEGVDLHIRSLLAVWYCTACPPLLSCVFLIIAAITTSYRPLSSSVPLHLDRPVA